MNPTTSNAATMPPESDAMCCQNSRQTGASMGPSLLTGTVIEVNRPGTPLCVRLAASLATKIVSDLGARVIKIEPPGGDPVRHLPPLLHKDNAGTSAVFQFLNTGKEAVLLDLRQSRGREVLAAMLTKADAVVDEAEPAQEDDEVGALVRVWLSAFGARPEMRSVSASELSILALGGLLDLVGDPARAPLRLGGHQAAYSAGLAAYAGLMAGIMGSKRYGTGEIIDISLLDVALWVNWKSPAGALMLGRAPTREGPQAEWQVLPCADGYVALVYADKDWPALCRLAREPKLAAVEFLNAAGRRRRREEVLQLLTRAFAGRTRRELYAEIKDSGIPMGPVFSPRELLEDPQYLARDFMAEVSHAEFGAFRMPRVPVRWNGAAFQPSPAPHLPASEEDVR